MGTAEEQTKGLVSESTEVVIMSNQGYWVMDGRAHDDVDSALVLEACHDFAEARESIFDYGDDTCIVDAETQEIVDSLLWRKADE